MTDTSQTAGEASRKRTAIALAVGAVVAGAASGLWAWVTIATGAEVGIAVWLIGLVVGIAVLVAGRGGSMARALGAAGLTLLGIAAGTLIIAHFGLEQAAADRIVDDEHLLAEAVFHDMVEHDELDDDVVDFEQTAPADRLPNQELTRRLLETQADVSGRAHHMSQQEKQEVAEAFARHRVAQLSWHERAGLSPWSLLWIVLAAGTAFGVCAPHRSSASQTPNHAAREDSTSAPNPE
jgi:hypothetical protein